MDKAISQKVLKNLNRVEGQVRGIAQMVEADRYCIDVVTQIEAARAALARIESDLLRQHLGHCVHRAMNSKNASEQEKVIEELVGIFRRWGQGIDHARGAPNHPQTQGKIERWHQTLKNRILLENYYLPGDLEAQIGDFVSHYNHRRYHESLGKLTPADVYSGRGQTILMKREAIKQRTFEQCRLQHAGGAA